MDRQLCNSTAKTSGAERAFILIDLACQNCRRRDQPEVVIRPMVS
jgi:hypothetical protein